MQGANTGSTRAKTARFQLSRRAPHAEPLTFAGILSAMVDQLDDEVSWREITLHSPVISSDGQQVGEVVEVAALDQEDIFHGVVFKSSRVALQHHVAPAADIARITMSAVHLSVDAAAAATYPEFHQLHIERVGLKGLWRWKHYGWTNSKE